MENERHIKGFGEFKENLNISDVSDSYDLPMEYEYISRKTQKIVMILNGLCLNFDVN